MNALAGYCVPCQELGQMSQAADPAGTTCQYHLRMPGARPRRPGRLPAAPRRRPAGHAAAPSGRLKRQWRRAFLRCSPVRKAPKATGSRRRLSPERMEEHAALLVVQAATARRTHRPTGWLALVLYDLDANRPPGASRADARDNIARLAAVLAVSADWRSGRRSRPGRQVAAALLGRAERTITRHLRLLEGRELARREGDGELLDAEKRAAAQADEDVSPDQRRRWVDRAEWTLLIPPWARELTVEQLWPYIQRAAALLDDLAAPAVGRGPVDNPGDGAVDNRPAQAANSGSVTPSPGFEVLGSVPVRRGSFSQPVVVDEPAPASTPIPAEKEHKGGASRHSPTNEGGSGSRRGMPPGAVRLARQLVAEGRLPFLRGAEVHRVAGALRRFALWTPDDVVAEVELRLAECRKAMLATAAAPAAYLAWLLQHAVPGEPPAQIAAALAESARAERTERDERQRRAWAERAAAAVPAVDCAGGREARRLVDALAERRRQNRRWRRPEEAS